MTAQHILVVDNDPLQTRTLELSLQKLFDCSVTALNGGQEAIAFLTSEEGRDVDVVLLDLVMPEVDGLEVLRNVRPVRPHLPIIIVSAHGEISAAVEAMSEGAVDFVEKKDGDERLKVSIQNALRIQRLQGEVSRLERSNTGETSFNDIIGDSVQLLETKKLAQKAAESNIPVLLQGESGVGKELFARAIHGSGIQAGKPFVAVNCGAIPETLVESTLFGHEKGAFTGAVEKNIGKFREADGGTLFLDEIGELKPELQVKLLRTLQEGEVEPVGNSKSVKINVRIISATNRPLKDDIASGQFREDLYYRLNVFPVRIPPLRERTQDITLLVDYFIQRIATQENKHILGITDEANQLLKRYAWPGNIRQLQNAIYRAVVMTRNEWLDREEFGQILGAMEAAGVDTAPETSAKESDSAPMLNSPQLVDGSNYLRVLGENSEVKTLSEIEAELIEYALEFYEWRISEVARRLKIGRSTLYRKMSEFGLSEKTRQTG